MTVRGLHHVTATANDAQADLDFFERTLGLRLVKKTVNFDNHNVYHFYYGDERGTPGTIWTTFPYRGHGVRVGTKGIGQITSTAFSIPAGSLPFWRRRLRERGFDSVVEPPRFGEEVLCVTDTSGLTIELIASDRDARTPWLPHDLSTETAIRGVHSVTMTIAAPRATIDFMHERLGFEVVAEDTRIGRSRVAVHGDAPGRSIDILQAVDASPAINGLGTVHHVAMAVPTAADQLQVRQELLRAGVRVTEVLDRQYFTSIYFREPGGVLFEIATMGPGFAVDEPVAELGTSLKLPWWEERHRQEIEAGLAPVT